MGGYLVPTYSNVDPRLFRWRSSRHVGNKDALKREYTTVKVGYNNWKVMANSTKGIVLISCGCLFTANTLIWIWICLHLKYVSWALTLNWNINCLGKYLAILLLATFLPFINATPQIWLLLATLIMLEVWCSDWGCNSAASSLTALLLLRWGSPGHAPCKARSPPLLQCWFLAPLGAV